MTTEYEPKISDVVESALGGRDGTQDSLLTAIALIELWQEGKIDQCEFTAALQKHLDAHRESLISAYIDSDHDCGAV